MSQRREMLLKNMEFVGYDDLNGKPGFQMALHKAGERYYLYTASFRHNGWNIVEVTDPYHPRNVKWMEGPWVSDLRDGQSTPKIQIADGLMLTAHGGTMKELHGTEPGLPFWGGLMIWDVASDPENPRLISRFPCGGGPGVHRFFYNGGRYAYIVGSCEGFLSFILRIVDLADPAHPVEVGRWWNEEQYLGSRPGGEPPRFGSAEFLSMPMLHACTVRDDVAYLACPNKGLVLLDVKDKTQPRLVGRLPLNPPFGGGAAGAAVHTALPLGERPYVVVSTEGERARYFANETTQGLFKKIVTQPMNNIGIAEITDPTNPSLISLFPYPEMPEGYTHGANFNVVDGVRVPFGPHNCFDAFGPSVYERRADRVYNCYFHAGLRVYDVSDPFIPREIACFLPPDPEKDCFDNAEGNLMPGPRVAITEDVLVDDRGYIYVDTCQDGLYIVRCTV